MLSPLFWQHYGCRPDAVPINSVRRTPRSDSPQRGAAGCHRAPFAKMIVGHLIRHDRLPVRRFLNRQGWPLAAGIEFIQHVIEDFVAWLFAHISTFCFRQVRVKMLQKLRFGYFRWNFHHDPGRLIWATAGPPAVLRAEPADSLS